MTSEQSVLLRVGVTLEELYEDEETENWPFRELLGGLLWLAFSTRPDISNAVRSVARYCYTPKATHWKPALGIIAYTKDTSGFRIKNQRGISVGVVFRDFCRRRLRQ